MHYKTEKGQWRDLSLIERTAACFAFCFFLFFFLKRRSPQGKNCDFYVAALSIDSLRSKHI